MNNIACCIFSYEITKGMKSFGPLGLLKSGTNNKELILQQIDRLYDIFDSPHIFVITGFGGEKIQKKIPDNVKTITNNKFDTKNHGYALKLILSEYLKNNLTGGLLLINSGILIKYIDHQSIPNDKSWIISKKNKKNQFNNSKKLGCVWNINQTLEYIFYDIGHHSWCESVYLCHNDILRIIKSIDTFYDNMFLFEIINQSVNKNNVYYHQVVVPNASVCEISGMKDKTKIK